MPPKPKLKFVCTDKKPLEQGEIRGRAGFCFKRGVKAGFIAGLRKAEKDAVKKKKGKVLTELKTKTQQKREAEERRRMAQEDVNRARPRERRPSLATGYQRYKAEKRDARERDYYMQLRFANPEYNRVSATARKAMGTAGLKAWVLRSGEYVE